MTRVVKAYRFGNGNVMAFGEQGQQVAEYQGPDAIEKLGRDFPDLRIEDKDWQTDRIRGVNC